MLLLLLFFWGSLTSIVLLQLLITDVGRYRVSLLAVVAVAVFFYLKIVNVSTRMEMLSFIMEKSTVERRHIFIDGHFEFSKATPFFLHGNGH